MPKPHSDKDMQIALAAYVRNDMTTKEIAKIARISPSTLTVWAVNAGLPLRSRGRRTQDEPSERSRRMLEMCQTSTDEAVGAHFGVCKQAVQQLRTRWANYHKPKKPPFEPGDVIRWKGRRWTVVAASMRTGTLVDSKGRMHFQWRWVQNGYVSKKIGRNPKYAVAGRHHTAVVRQVAVANGWPHTEFNTKTKGR
jgi:transposase